MNECSFLRSLQTAVYGAMIADTALMAQVTGVYDLIPPEAVCPYLVLTVQSGAALRTKTRNGERLTVIITVVTAEPGFRVAQDIAAEVSRFVSEGSFLLSGAVLVTIQTRTITCDLDETARKVTARIVCEAIVQEAA